MPLVNMLLDSGYTYGLIELRFHTGLIHANHGDEKTINFLKDQLKLASVNVKHGACLGLGLAALGTHKQGSDYLLFP